MISFAVNQQSGKKIPLRFWRLRLKKIKQTLKSSDHWEISLALVGEGAMKKLNRIYRGENRVTDVLSFSEKDSRTKFGVSSSRYLGEIIICYPQAKRQAKKFGHSVNQELEMLLIHGFLHLLGYDHQKARDRAKMQRLERKILGLSLR
ncbi:MAG: rRNA maturation RNase YbeY [Patescibacteria group bacterium]|jgi:probable rRNA maturation factor